MKKKDKKTIGKRLLWLCCLMTCLVSCQPDPSIEANPTEQTFSYMGGNSVIHVAANCRWIVKAEENYDWFNLSQSSGKNDADISVIVQRNTTQNDRDAIFTIQSSNGKAKVNVSFHQIKPDITSLTEKIWFMDEYERWDLDYSHQVIEDSYRHYYYDIMSIETENWFFYFLNDSTGYQVCTHWLDTSYFEYNYLFYPEGDSLYIDFVTLDDSREDYHVTIHELNTNRFVFGDEYSPNRFEKIYTAIVPTKREFFRIDPKKVRPKPAGPLIQKKR